ncbi:MAG: HDOD domain-containing protein [Nitrospirae bacterium]|nr:HDOD domain-containing protein [Nitrospirota bacterium]
MSAPDESILQGVEKQLDSMHIGFSLGPEDRAVLDQPHMASKHQILKLEDNLPVTVRNELFQIANSPFYTKDGARMATDFWEVSSILGLENIKSYIMVSALYGVGATNPDIVMLKNKCLATAGLSMAIMHNVLGYDRASTPKVQLCAMLSECGKIPFFLYKQNNASDRAVVETMTETYINIHHGKFGLRIIEKFNLPEFLRDLFLRESLIFFDSAHEFSITTIVRMAKLLVRESFKQHGKLVLTSVVDDNHGVVSGSVGTEIQEFFDVLGIRHLISVIPFETPPQKYAREKSRNRKT